MGINKSNIRCVVHVELPESLLAYMQEIGRAGRDGKPALAITIYNKTDIANLESKVESLKPDMEMINRVYRSILSYCEVAPSSGDGLSTEFSFDQFCNRYELKRYPAYISLKWLQLAEYIHFDDELVRPPRIYCHAPEKEVYKHMVENPDDDLILKALFKFHPGVTNSFVVPDFTTISHFTRLPLPYIESRLRLMAEKGILLYSPSVASSRLTILKPVPPDARITIPGELIKTYIEARKKDASMVIDFITGKERCRVQSLYSIVERVEEKCKICDNCINEMTRLTFSEFLDIKKKISTSLEKNNLTLTELLKSFPPGDSWKYRAVLEWLLQTQKVKNEKGILSLQH